MAIPLHPDIALEILIHNKVDINAVGPWGKTALIEASANHRLGIVRELLKRENLDVNAKDDNGYTALMMACKNGFLMAEDTIVELLKVDGVDENAKDGTGKTALIWVICHGNRSPVH